MILNIINVKGLHARASGRFVEVCESFDAKATVSKDGETVAGDSILGLMTLSASLGSEIDVVTSGPQAEALLEALKKLVDNKFGEDK
ncbi:MAG: HPr family phosphocarrier protein [Rhodobacteraceae bacterium]|nr:HPr family phosphocarrier protein [Paracoccaceae bacterium]